MISLKIMSPSNVLLECDADIVTMPGENGELGVLPRHALLMVNLKSGIVKISANSRDYRIFVLGGIVQITGEKVNLVTEFAFNLSDLSKAEIVKKLAEFKETLDSKIDLSMVT